VQDHDCKFTKTLRDCFGNENPPSLQPTLIGGQVYARTWVRRSLELDRRIRTSSPTEGERGCRGQSEPSQGSHERVGSARLRPAQPERARFWRGRAQRGCGRVEAGAEGERTQDSHHRVGEGRLRRPEPERARVCEPLGSHHRVGEGRLRSQSARGFGFPSSRRRRPASPAGARAREGLGTLPGFPS